jgi:HEAT repeat protein
MSSFKILSVAVCLLTLALPVHGDNRKDDRSQYPPGYTNIPNEIGGKTYDQWKAELSHRDPSVRANAIMAIPYFRERSEDSVPLLVKCTYDSDASPRAKAVLALKMMGIRGSDVTRVVQALGRLVGHDSQAIIRFEAAQALTRFGADTREVVGDLVKGIGDSSTWEIRHACIIALIYAGVDKKKGPDLRVTDALLLRINSYYYEPTTQVRLRAIMALGAMGRPQDPSKLKQVLLALQRPENYKSSNKVIRIWSHVSLMALEDKANEKDLKTIAEYLKDHERDVRVQAVTALGALQDKAHEYISDILRLLQEEKEMAVLAAACNALCQMGDGGDKVRKALIKLTEFDDAASTSVVLAACNALAQIGVASPDAMEALNKVLAHKALSDQAKDIVKKDIVEIKKPKKDLRRVKDDDKPKGDKKKSSR